ncbi:MAG: succinate dehydrogenase, cytochrome b556 subunit [Actinomycetota bacterium]|nr:succinate dehydrogenase, cytochrome b556 subunit [Actinomycetota bacterium]
MGKPRGTLYRGGPGMITWVLHRITGVLIFFFLFAHILDTSLVAVGDGRLYDSVIAVYRNPIVTLMEMGLVVAVIYHAMNGIKVTLIDFWSKGTERIRALSAATVVLTVLLSGAAVGIMGKTLIEELQRGREQAMH